MRWLRVASELNGHLHIYAMLLWPAGSTHSAGISGPAPFSKIQCHQTSSGSCARLSRPKKIAIMGTVKVDPKRGFDEVERISIGKSACGKFFPTDRHCPRANDGRLLKQSAWPVRRQKTKQLPSHKISHMSETAKSQTNAFMSGMRALPLR